MITPTLVKQAPLNSPNVNNIRANAPLEQIHVSMDDFITIVLDTNQWLITQTTAYTSVNLFDGYKITPNSAVFVNNNGNCWSTELTKRIFKSFIGAHNYKNHIQIPEKSYGIVIDAVPRAADVKGEHVIVVDILVATNREKNRDWCSAIESGIIKYGSVGCSCSCLQCTECGLIAPTPKEWCNHMRYNRGKYFIDKLSGMRLRQANMITDYPNKIDRSFANFTEWSYLDNNPAFSGAVLSHIITLPKDKTLSFQVPADIQTRQAFTIWSPYFNDVLV